DLTGARLSVGTLVEWVRQRAEAVMPVEEQLKAALRTAQVPHSYETGVRRGGRAAGVGACGEHSAVDPLRDPRQAEQRGDQRQWHPA
ncbi:MAG: IS66 family transposase, partial [Ktedonobacterales bacterium]